MFTALDNLLRVSITGADDQTDVQDLLDLIGKYPFVEFAILYYPEKEGKPRNPTMAWRDNFLVQLSYYCRHINKAHPNLDARRFAAAHLCGNHAFYQLLADALPGELRRYGRIQLNVNARETEFTPLQVLQIYEKALKIGPDIVLQYHDRSAMVIDHFLTKVTAGDAKRVHVLNDGSLGRGVTPNHWIVPHRPFRVVEGFAGGMAPDNYASAVAQINTLGVPFWTDCETGVRTDNQLDRNKVEAMLQIAAPRFKITHPASE